jgi:short-subunit dehydrogenase
MAKRDFRDKRVLLTGASSGIGWYLASELVRAGAFVVVTSRRSDRLQQLRLSFGNPRKRLIAVPGDIAEAAHRDKLIETAVTQLGGIDIVINNAGIGAVGNFEHASPERLRRVFDVDFFAATELTRSAIPHLKQGRQPAICLVNSVLGHRGVPGKSEYCAAKFALRGWSESLRLELRSVGIDVVSISPSTTHSEFFDSLIEAPAGLRHRNLGAQSSQSVARSILGALRMRKRDMILSPGGKALVWLSRLAPQWTDQLLLKFAA